MEKKSLFENIKVGDTVILESGPPYNRRYTYEKVEKITSRGYIKVKEMLFYEDNGIQKTDDKWNYCHIYEKDDKRIVKIFQNQKNAYYIRKVKAKLNTFSEKQWTIEIANKVEAFLSEIEKVSEND